MWSVILVTRPTEATIADTDIGGAFATVFVDEPYEEIAEAAARKLVEERVDGREPRFPRVG